MLLGIIKRVVITHRRIRTSVIFSGICSVGRRILSGGRGILLDEFLLVKPLVALEKEGVMLVHDHGGDAIHTLLEAEGGVVEVELVGGELIFGPGADGEHGPVVGEAGMGLNADLLELGVSDDSLVVVLAETEPLRITLITLINDNPQDAVLVELELKLQSRRQVQGLAVTRCVLGLRIVWHGDFGRGLGIWLLLFLLCHRFLLISLVIPWYLWQSGTVMLLCRGVNRGILPVCGILDVQCLDPGLVGVLTFIPRRPS